MTRTIAPDDGRVRVVWTAPEGAVRLIARAWDDGAPPSYGVQIREREGVWLWGGSGDDRRRALDAVTRWLDQQARDREREKDQDRYQGEG